MLFQVNLERMCIVLCDCWSLSLLCFQSDSFNQIICLTGLRQHLHIYAESIRFVCVEKLEATPEN